MPHQLKFYTKTELIWTNSQAPNRTKTTSKEKGSSRGKKFIHISKTLNSNPTRARTLRPTYPSRGHVWFWPFTPRPLCKFQNIKALVGFVPLTLCNGFLGEKKCLTRKNANVDNPNKKLFLWLNSRFQFCQIQELKTLNITEKINLDGHVTPCKMQMFMGNQKAKKKYLNLYGRCDTGNPRQIRHSALLLFCLHFILKYLILTWCFANQVILTSDRIRVFSQTIKTELTATITETPNIR